MSQKQKPTREERKAAVKAVNQARRNFGAAHQGPTSWVSISAEIETDDELFRALNNPALPWWARL